MIQALLELFGGIFAFAGHITGGSSFPEPLSPEEEKDCIARLEAGDAEARRLLIEHNLRLVAHIAKKYTTPKRDADDVISIGKHTGNICRQVHRKRNTYVAPLGKETGRGGVVIRADRHG